MVARLDSPHVSAIHVISQSDRRLMTSSAFDRSVVWDLETLKPIKQQNDSQCERSLLFGPNHVLSVFSRRQKIFLLSSDSFLVLKEIQFSRLLSINFDYFVLKDDTNCLICYSSDSQEKIVSNRVPLWPQLDAKHVKHVTLKPFLIVLTFEGFLHSFQMEFTRNESFLTFLSNNRLIVGFKTNEEISVFKTQNNSQKLFKTIKTNEISVKQKAIILLEKCGKFPEKFRPFLWSQLLELPNNEKSFAKLRKTSKSLSLDLSLDLEPKLKTRLTDLLKQLFLWRPQLAEEDIQDLSLFAFPFVKLLKNPLIVFETISSLITNNFFFDKKLKKTKLFSHISRIISLESQEITRHLEREGLSVEALCQPIVKSLFSEAVDDWPSICDHLFAFGSQMILYFCVSLILTSNHVILKSKEKEKMKQLFRNQLNSVKSVVECAHHLSRKYIGLGDNSSQSLSPLIY